MLIFPHRLLLLLLSSPGFFILEAPGVIVLTLSMLESFSLAISITLSPPLLLLLPNALLLPVSKSTWLAMLLLRLVASSSSLPLAGDAERNTMQPTSSETATCPFSPARLISRRSWARQRGKSAQIGARRACRSVRGGLSCSERPVAPLALVRSDVPVAGAEAPTGSREEGA